MPYTFERPPELRDLTQVYSYLYRMSEELEGALNNITSSDIKDLETKVESAISKGTGGATGTSELITKTSELKSLIIMTADTVNAKMDEIRQTLEGEYVASSDFGTFSQKYFRDITQNAYGDQNIYQYMTDVQAGNDQYITDTKAKIFTGLLYTTSEIVDGVQRDVPHFGVGIAEQIYTKDITYSPDGVNTVTETGIDPDQTTTISYFTSDRLQFYIGGNEVAYITNQELYITRGRFGREIRIGNIAGVIDGTDPSIVRWYVKG